MCGCWAEPTHIGHATHRALSQQCPPEEGRLQDACSVQVVIGKFEKSLHVQPMRFRVSRSMEQCSRIAPPLQFCPFSQRANLVHSCLHAKLRIVLFFPHSRQSETRSDTLAIPFWYMNAHKSILSPHGFPLVEFQLWTCKKRSCD